MEKMNIEQEILSIHKKLDFLTEQFQKTQSKQQEMQELKNDLTLIGKDIFDSAVVELQDVAPYFDTDDLIYLVKKLLRNTRTMTKMLEQLESAQDLFKDIQPLGKQVFDEILSSLNAMDKKGYFEFFGEAAKIVDTIVTSFSVDDVKMLREEITSILITVKNMTQPEMLSSVNNALGFFQKMDIIIEKDVSTWQLIKKAKDPEVKKGMAFMLEFVKNMAKPEKTISTN
jgi:uncharacterized protein YjgD (DUF1641 family)